MTSRSFAAGTVAKLVAEGYTGYLLRATNDDMGDAPGLGTPGTIGQNVLGNERDNDRSRPHPGAASGSSTSTTETTGWGMSRRTSCSAG